MWVFFPKKDWDAVPEKERLHNEQLVTARGIGLLLVKGKTCELRIPAPRNPHKDDDSVADVFDALGESPDVVFPALSVLGAAEAKRAAGTMALVAIVKDIVAEIFDCEWDDSGHEAAWVRHGFYTTWCEVEDISAEVDPWGSYMRDGIPVLWLRQNVTPKQFLKRLNSSGELPGTHCYFDNEQWDWEMVPIKELSIRMVDLLFKEHLGTGDECLAVVHRIDILGRRRRAVESEIRRAYERFRKLKL